MAITKFTMAVITIREDIPRAVNRCVNGRASKGMRSASRTMVTSHELRGCLHGSQNDYRCCKTQNGMKQRMASHVRIVCYT
jgi:hypothetical protein